MKYLVCNLKNKMNLQETKIHANKVNDFNIGKTQLIIMPSYPFFSFYEPISYELGSQDISSFKDTTATGEITSEQLKDFNVNYVLIGHSERRILKNEINIDFINKINHAQSSNLKVIYCIGETLRERENGQIYDTLEQQMSEVLNNVIKRDIIIAYEPVWAIGTNMSPNAADIENIIQYIKDIGEEKYNINFKVLYGGSVNLKNIESLNNIKNIDGFLVGGSSLDADNIRNMLEIMDKN